MMGPMARYRLTERHIRTALDAAGAVDADVARAVAAVGYPEPRRRPQGFETLLRVIVGQQVSIHAAASIYGRLMDALGEDRSPARLLRLRETTLKKAGLSRPKVRYARELSRALVDGTLDLEALPTLGDEDAMAQIQAVPGFGLWSAQIYVMFSLGRTDVWPKADVGLLNGLQKIKRLQERPSPAEGDALVEVLRPHRSAVALLAWKCAHSPAL